MPRIFFLLSCALCFACASVPRGEFIDPDFSIDYADPAHWAALPTLRDSADAVPVSTWKDEQSTAPADVFFIHPTTYTGKRGQKKWNADIDDASVNIRTDQYPVRYQGSIFNGAGKVYAPRYRQAHLECFYTQSKKDIAAKALDVAYQDVRDAFKYYLDHYNQGRPFIIAAHSQGTFHGARLVREMIEGTQIEGKLIVAYLPGLPVPEDYFKKIKPCRTPTETNCFCSWRTILEGALPVKMHFPDKPIVVTNPVSWTLDGEVAGREMHKGAVLKDFNTVRPGLVNARVYKDFLWISKPKFPGSFLLMTKNYHIADYNFFYADVRQNAKDRILAYLGGD